MFIGSAGKLCARALAAALLMSFGAAAGALAQTSAEPLIFRIATASKAGTFYPIGSLIAEGITGQADCSSQEDCGVEGVIAIAQVSNGSVANVESVSAGAVEAGLAQADVIYWAYGAKGRFAGQEPLADLRAVANLYPGSLHIVTAADSGIESVSDLRGKRVALDEPGSGTLATAELILASVGIGKGDLSPLYIKHNHAGPMLAAGELDAFFFVAGYPTRSVLDLAETTEIRLVPLSQATIEAISAERPYLAPGEIPAGAYPGIEGPVPTLDIGTQLIVNESLPKDLVRDLTAALWNARSRQTSGRRPSQGGAGAPGDGLERHRDPAARRRRRLLPQGGADRGLGRLMQRDGKGREGGVRRSSIGRLMLVALLLAASVGVIGYVYLAIKQIEEELPLRVMEEKRDMERAARNLYQFLAATEAAQAHPTEGNVENIRNHLASVEHDLETLRSRYTFDTLIGASALHALINPAVVDARIWLTEGFGALTPTSPILLDLVGTRVRDTMSKVFDKTTEADRVAYEIWRSRRRS